MADETMTLLPCPFCGETFVSAHEGSTFRWMQAECDHCGASCGEVRVQTHGNGTPEKWREQGKRDAIDAWNRRAPDIAAAEIARLTAELEKCREEVLASSERTKNCWMVRS